MTLEKDNNNNIKLIALYLPQYHTIPENDAWWGEGFTEWTNVTKAKPLFKNHYQPKIPADEIGYYNLLDSEIQEKQVKLAKEHGIYGFCYYHYWFKGKKLLEKPFESVLKNKKLDHSFCLCWANHPWKRNWGGRGEHEILQPQEYGNETDWKEHFNQLLPAFKDKRYIKIDEKPIFLIFWAGHIPCASQMISFWQKEAKKAGFKGLFIIAMFSGSNYSDYLDNSVIDAACEFQPAYAIGTKRFSMFFSSFLNINYEARKFFLKNIFSAFLNNNKKICRPIFDNIFFSKNILNIYSYDSICRKSINIKKNLNIQFKGIFPSWDNTPRRFIHGWIIEGSTPEKYEKYLKQIITKTKKDLPKDKQIIFINAWNEWAEGCYLEPDKRYERKYLEATKRALETI